MGFKIGKVFRNIVKVAAPIVGAVVPGIGTAIAGVALAGVKAYEANKAKKQAYRAAVAQGNAQQAELLKRDIIADEYYQAEKKAFDEEVKRIDNERNIALDKLEEAKRNNDQESEKLYHDIINELERNKGQVLGILENQQNLGDQYLSEQYEETIKHLTSDIDANRELRRQYGVAVDQSVSEIDANQQTLHTELEKEKARTRPEGLDAAMSEIEGGTRDFLAEQKRIEGAKNKELSKGVTLAAKIQEAKAKGKVSADLRRGFQQRRLGNISALTNQLNRGSQLRSNLRGNRAAMREDGGEILADAGERFTNRRVTRGDRFANQEADIVDSVSAEKRNAVTNLREGRIHRNDQHTSNVLNNRRYFDQKRTNAQNNLSGALTTSVGIKTGTKDKLSDIYGNAASRNFNLAREAKNQRDGAIKEGVIQGVGIVKDIFFNRGKANKTKNDNYAINYRPNNSYDVPPLPHSGRRIKGNRSYYPTQNIG